MIFKDWQIRGRLALVLGALCLLAQGVQGQGFTGVLTWHNDNARTGQNLNETTLTPQNVSFGAFGKLFVYPVDGQIYAQPLYVPNVTIPGQGVHNVVYVATENDGVYALDADGLTSVPLWYDSFVNAANGVTAVPCTSMAQSCNVYPVDGITGTPVIDQNSGTLYLVTLTLENGNSYVQRLHALDTTTGAEKLGGPVIIQGSVPGKGAGSQGGTVTFDPQHNLQRPGLLLLNGRLYIAWAGSAHGWLMAYDAQTLAQLAVFNTTPNGVLGGIWSSGSGLAADGLGNIYVATGDGTFDASTGGLDFGDTLLKLNGNLTVLDYFTPMDQVCRRLNDLDLGGGGPLILPPQAGPYANEIIMSGKGGTPCDLFGSSYASPIYVVNRDQLGGYNSQSDQVIQTIAGAPFGYHSNPAFWQGPSAAYIYYAGLTSEAGSGDYLKMYTLSNGKLSSTPTAQTTTNFVIGATSSISANGSNNGILWAMERQDILSARANLRPAILYAFDATNVANMLYSSTQAGTRDQAGPATKFQVPTIANGKVYLGTLTELDVYGLLAGQVATTTTLNSNNNPSVYGQSIVVTATVTSSAGTPSGNVSFYNGNTLLGSAFLSSGQASFTISGLNTGVHTFSATYDGAATFAVSSGSMIQTINKAPTSTTITSSSLNPSTYGQSVTFTASVTSSAGVPTGTVTFKKGRSVMGTATLSTGGVATFSTSPTQLTGGNDSITATYSPDRNHATSTSPVFTQTVNLASTTVTFTSAPNPSSVNQSVTLTATVNAAVGTPTGNVVFKDGTTILQTIPLTNGTAVLNTSFSTAGAHSLKAGYQGSTNYLPSSATITQTVQ